MLPTEIQKMIEYDQFPRDAPQQEGIRGRRKRLPINISGRRFGLLTAIEVAGYTSKHEAKWLCQCDCGRLVTVRGCHLRDGNTRSCGCIKSPHKKVDDLIRQVNSMIAEKKERDKNLALLVKGMREAQKEYFRTRSKGDLLKSKALEAQVDRLVAELFGGDIAL